MDGIGAAAAALAVVVLLAAGLRGGVQAARRAVARVRRWRAAAASRARTLGLRGLVAALAGTASATASTLTAAAAATAAPAPDAPAAGSSATGASASSHIAKTSALPATYVVRPGDSLWSIAAHHLGPGASDAAIAAEWPRWYRANRAVIGSNPSLLHVGTRLHVPHGRRTGTSASPHSTHAPSGPGRTALSLDPDRR